MAISTSLLANRVGRVTGARRRILVAAGLVALGAGMLYVSRSWIAHAREIEVTGVAHLSRVDVVARAGVSRETNVVWLDEPALERRLESLPWVADADVGVAFPTTIRIAVVERVPVAIVTDGTSRTLIAADGTRLGPAARTRGLPRIELSGPPADGARPSVSVSTASANLALPSPRAASRALGSMRPELRSAIRRVTVHVDGTLEMRMLDGVLVRYGSDAHPEAKARALGRILAWAGATGARLSHVNVAAPRAPAVRLER